MSDKTLAPNEARITINQMSSRTIFDVYGYDGPIYAKKIWVAGSYEAAKKWVEENGLELVTW